MHVLELLFETGVLEADASVEVFADRAGHIHADPGCVPDMRPAAPFDNTRRAGDLLGDLARLCRCFDEPTRYPVSMAEANTLACLRSARTTLTITDPVTHVSLMRTLAGELAEAARWTPHLARWVAAAQEAVADRVATVRASAGFRVSAGRRLQPREGGGATGPVSDEQAEADWVAALADQRWYLLTDLDWVAVDAGLLALVGDFVPGNRCVTLPVRVAWKLWFASALAPFNVPAARSRADVEAAFRISGELPAAVPAALGALVAARS